MIPTIYLDILYCINLFITYLLLLSTRALAQSNTPHLRVVLAALVGAASSFLIVFPHLPGWIFWGIKLGISALIVWIAFSHRRFWKTCLIFYLVNFLYGGLVLAVMQWINFPNAFFHRGILYFNLSAMRLCLLTVIAYGVLQLFSAVLFHTTSKEKLTSLRIQFQKQTVTVTALLDTGNSTRDVLSGLPVVVCQSSSLAELLPPEVLEYASTLRLEQLSEEWKKTFRLIPVKSIGGNSLLAGFVPTSCEVLQEGRFQPCEVVLAMTKQNLSDGDFYAIAPSKLVR